MYLSPIEVQKRFGYHPKTLSRWAEEGKIEHTKSVGGHRRYSLKSLEKLDKKPHEDERLVVMYARVSTYGGDSY